MIGGRGGVWWRKLGCCEVRSGERSRLAESSSAKTIYNHETPGPYGTVGRRREGSTRALQKLCLAPARLVAAPIRADTIMLAVLFAREGR